MSGTTEEPGIVADVDHGSIEIIEKVGDKFKFSDNANQLLSTVVDRLREIGQISTLFIYSIASSRPTRSKEPFKAGQGKHHFGRLGCYWLVCKHPGCTFGYKVSLDQKAASSATVQFTFEVATITRKSGSGYSPQLGHSRNCTCQHPCHGAPLQDPNVHEQQQPLDKQPQVISQQAQIATATAVRNVWTLEQYDPQRKGDTSALDLSYSLDGMPFPLGPEVKTVDPKMIIPWVDRPLGSGGDGTVFKVMVADPSIGQAALKVPHPHMMMDKQARKVLDRAATIWRMLSNKEQTRHFIVPLLAQTRVQMRDQAAAPGSPLYDLPAQLMPLLLGDVAAWGDVVINGGAERRFDRMALLSTCLKVAAILQHLQDLGFVIGDFTPHNLLRAVSGELRLADMSVMIRYHSDNPAANKHPLRGRKGWFDFVHKRQADVQHEQFLLQCAQQAEGQREFCAEVDYSPKNDICSAAFIMCWLSWVQLQLEQPPGSRQCQDAGKQHGTVHTIHGASFLALVECCMAENLDLRPSADQLVERLQQLQQRSEAQVVPEPEVPVLSAYATANCRVPKLIEIATNVQCDPAIVPPHLLALTMAAANQASPDDVLCAALELLHQQVQLQMRACAANTHVTHDELLALLRAMVGIEKWVGEGGSEAMKQCWQDLQWQHLPPQAEGFVRHPWFMTNERGQSLLAMMALFGNSTGIMALSTVMAELRAQQKQLQRSQRGMAGAVPPYWKLAIRQWDQYECRPLDHACWVGVMAAAALCLVGNMSAAEINKRNKFGTCPLLDAAEFRGRHELLAMLLAKRADPLVKEGSHGWQVTALHKAGLLFDADMQRALVQSCRALLEEVTTQSCLTAANMVAQYAEWQEDEEMSVTMDVQELRARQQHKRRRAQQQRQ